MADGPNDHNAWSDEEESERPATKRAPRADVDPNPSHLTQWADPSEKAPTGRRRAVDLALADTELFECPKCRFQTRSRDVWERHTREVDGMAQCERERERFKKEGPPPAIDAEALGSTVAKKVAEALTPAFKMIGEALGLLAGKKDKNDGSAGVVPRGDQDDRPESLGAVEQPDREVAGPPQEPKKAE